MFERFGVGDDAEKVYRHLLIATDADLAALARASDLTDDLVVRACDELDTLGLTLPRAEAPSGRYALPPDQAFEVLLAREEARLDAELAALRATREEVPALVDDYVAQRRDTVGDEIEYLADSPLVRSRLFQLTTEATQSVWGTHVGPAATPEAVRAALPLDRATTERGLTSRMIIDLESLGPAHWDAYLSELLVLGHELRVLAATPQLMLIFDGDHALVPGQVDNGSTSAYVLHGPHLVAPLRVLFEELWHSAEPYGESRLTTDSQFSPARMRQVATLLAKGHKDEAVARRIGTSVRTVRRTIAALSDELRAESRFQAGYLAGAKGWVDLSRADVDADASA